MRPAFPFQCLEPMSRTQQHFLSESWPMHSFWAWHKRSPHVCSFSRQTLFQIVLLLDQACTHIQYRGAKVNALPQAYLEFSATLYPRCHDAGLTKQEPRIPPRIPKPFLEGPIDPLHAAQVPQCGASTTCFRSTFRC